jgi:hypothetical protein
MIEYVSPWSDPKVRNLRSPSFLRTKLFTDEGNHFVNFGKRFEKGGRIDEVYLPISKI